MQYPQYLEDKLKISEETKYVKVNTVKRSKAAYCSHIRQSFISSGLIQNLNLTFTANNDPVIMPKERKNSSKMMQTVIKKKLNTPTQKLLPNNKTKTDQNKLQSSFLSASTSQKRQPVHNTSLLQ